MEKIDNKYEVGDWLIYPKHGLGKAIDYEVQTILKKKIVSEKEFKIIDSKILNKIKMAADFAENSPKPATEELYKDVYAN